MQFSEKKDNLMYWDALKKPPKDALKTIKGGRLQGMTDVNPQWRYEAMTETFGPVGVGWRYEIVKLWDYPLQSGEIMCFAQVNVFIRAEKFFESEWSQAIPGIGGSKLVSREKDGLYVSDEGYKMAVTDALSVALKAVGVASEIYRGRWDGSKYRDDTAKTEDAAEQPKEVFRCHEGLINELLAIVEEAKCDEPSMRRVVHALVPEKTTHDGKIFFSKFTAEEYNRVRRAFEDGSWKNHTTFQDDMPK